MKWSFCDHRIGATDEAVVNDGRREIEAGSPHSKGKLMLKEPIPSGKLPGRYLVLWTGRGLVSRA
jgi:hypothetical protein